MQAVKNKIYIFLIAPVLIITLAFQPYIDFKWKQAKEKEDPVLLIQYVDSLIKYRAYYPFIRYERNYIEWQNVEAIKSFFEKLSKTDVRKLKILHIGDSHIQADIPSGYIRERLQEIFGYGGRGLVFPYKAAGTHAAYDYKTYSTGKWEYNRSVQKDIRYDMGLIGATIHTSDSTATFKIVFREGFIKENFTLVKIYCKQDSLSFDLKVKTSQEVNPIYIDCNDYTNEKPYVLFQIPKATDTIEVFVNKTEKKQNFFECYGLMIESNQNTGVLYSSTGINGAGYRSLLRQRIFGEHLAEYKPDLVIIDLGANDFHAGGYNEAEMENNLSKIIDIIKSSSPESAILISNAQNIYYRRKYNVPQCSNFMELTKRVAEKNNCAFYNYFTVSGGDRSMDKWLKSGLARNDKVHLSAAGYYIRGELYLNAFLNSYKFWLQNPQEALVAERNIIDTSNLKKYFFEEINFKKENSKTIQQVAYNYETVESDGSNIIYYKIRSGDNLGSIAERFGVKVSQLQYWNGLSGTKIIAGETLIIYKSSPVQTTTKVTATPKNPINSTTVPPNTRNRKTYKVVKGDSLWTIAKKYNTTVEKIKAANNLKSDKLNIGQILIIP